MITLEPVIDFYGHLIPEPVGLVELDTAVDARPASMARAASGLLATSLQLGASQGRDVSSWDGPVNWSLLDFGINKASEGGSYVSPGTRARAAAIRGAGKRYSAYHYAQPGSGGAHADLMLAVDGMPRPGDFPGWLDYEVDGLGIGYLTSFMLQYHARVACWPGLYTGLSRFQSELHSGVGWKQTGQLLWLAHYGVASAGAPCDVWQHQGAPDLDTAYPALDKIGRASCRERVYHPV